MYRVKQWQIVLITATTLSVWFPAHSQGEPVTLDATLRGWHPPFGRNGSPITADSNYFVGFGVAEFRNGFLFDLSGLSGTVNAAKLRLTNPSDGFRSVDEFEQYTLFDVTSDFSLLGSGDAALYADLGTGISYGSYTASTADNGTVIELTLNAAAVQAIQAALGSEFATGGAITTLGMLGPGRAQSLFGNTGVGDVTQLQLDLTPSSVPEPSTILLLSTGAVAAWVKRKVRGNIYPRLGYGGREARCNSHVTPPNANLT